ALWQKARDHLPFLLDPAASPHPRVSASDGLIAALLFFVLQGLVLHLLLPDGEKVTGRMVLMAFCVAGGTTFTLMRLAFWRQRAQGVPRIFGPGSLRGIGIGAVLGASAAVVAIAYISLARKTSLFEDIQDSILTGRDALPWLTLLAVVAAPLFEEFIFRGLI